MADTFEFYVKNVSRFKTPDRPDLDDHISSIAKTMVASLKNNDPGRFIPAIGDVIYLHGAPYVIKQRILKPDNSHNLYSACSTIRYEVEKYPTQNVRSIANHSWTEEIPLVTDIEEESS